MSSSKSDGLNALAVKVSVTDDMLAVELNDGRSIAVPLVWYPRLDRATPKERTTFRLIGHGRGIHWPALDEDISVANLLLGQPSGESQSSLQQWLANREGNKGGRGRAKT